jgi:hypothetical protein
MKRAKKEQAIKTAMAGCLQERGFEVAGWSKKAKRPAVVESPVAPSSGAAIQSSVTQ